MTTPEQPGDTQPTDEKPDTEPASEATATSGETSFAVADPDVPTNPDEATIANIEAARYALSSRFSRRPYNAPKSMLMLGLVMLGTLTLGAGFLQFYRNSIKSTEQGELRRLEEREYISSRQAVFEDATGARPPGEIVKPLTPSEKSRLNQLLAEYGSIYTPDDDAKYLDASLRLAQRAAPTTRSPELEKKMLADLERQSFLADLHDEYNRLTGERAPMPLTVPLSSLELKRLKSYRDSYGPQWNPLTDDEAQHLESLVREARKSRPASRPAETQPAGI